MKNNIDNNIDIFNRKLLDLKEAIKLGKVTKGQLKFIEVYMNIALEHLDKSLDILDKKKYEELLLELDI